MAAKVSICIACYKDDPFLTEAVASCEMQTYPNEICIFHDRTGIGTGEAFNRAIGMAKGDIIVLLCSDDIFTDKHVISDIVKEFDNREIGHVSRWYHQFVNGDSHPVRAWRGENVIELANNPSGLAFRRSAMPPLTNKIFVEVSEPVSKIIKDGLAYSILRYDTVGVRIHKSISRTPGYYQKMFTTSPVLEWAKLGWKSTDFTSLIQIGVNFTKKAVWDESLNFIRINHWNIFNPSFILFMGIVLIVPRRILFYLPEIYRATWGRWTTKEIKRK